jgi:hypothetical protein
VSFVGYLLFVTAAGILQDILQESRGFGVLAQLTPEIQDSTVTAQ